MGIKASFYLTPELIERLILLRLEKDGVFGNDESNATNFERDPEKGV